MAAQGFLIEVTTRGQPSAIFAVAASSQSHAETLLKRGGQITGTAMAELKRLLNADDVAKHGVEPGSFVKLR